jgi:hypothetical protein
VITRDSVHIFDFDEGTVTWVPGPRAHPGLHDRPRPIRTIEESRVGEYGFWTMNTDGWSWDIDYYWSHTSRILRIERLPDGALPLPRPIEHKRADDD